MQISRSQFDDDSMMLLLRVSKILDLLSPYEIMRYMEKEHVEYLDSRYIKRKEVE